LFTEKTNILKTEDEPSGLKHVEDIVKLKHSFNKHAFFVGLYYTIILKCVVQKTLKKYLQLLFMHVHKETHSYDLCDIMNKLLILW